MSAIDMLEPVEVFRYFREICSIPHGSGNTKAISDYCVEFAKNHGLEYIQDDLNNVIIRKPASRGRENDKGIVLQGHLDMVAVKEPDSLHDFEHDALDLAVEGDMLYAKGTSLGGDDGIAIAYALAVLASETLKHPALEAVFTVDEEIGMLGADALDMSGITGSYLLNIDSEEEGVLLVSCAGGLSGDIALPVKRKKSLGIPLRLTVEGLMGGHSGTEIDKERCNAIQLMGRLLFELSEKFGCSLISLCGGEKDNAIAKACTAVLCVSDNEIQELLKYVSELEAVYSAEYISSDSGLRLVPEYVNGGESLRQDSIDAVSFGKIIFLLRQLPCGVQHYSADIEGLVETSMNLGIINMSKASDELLMTVSVRSSVESRKAELSNKVRYLTEFLGGSYSAHGEYPAWQHKRDSKLLSEMQRLHEAVLGSKAKVEAIHAGLECGILLKKKPSLEAVSFGPDIYDIHTAKEKMSISSVERMWRYLTAIIEEIS